MKKPQETGPRNPVKRRNYAVATQELAGPPTVPDILVLIPLWPGHNPVLILQEPREYSI